jgi:hypothetical protein
MYPLTRIHLHTALTSELITPAQCPKAKRGGRWVARVCSDSRILSADGSPPTRPFSLDLLETSRRYSGYCNAKIQGLEFYGLIHMETKASQVELNLPKILVRDRRFPKPHVIGGTKRVPAIPSMPYILRFCFVVASCPPD